MFRSIIICTILVAVAAFNPSIKNVRKSQTIVRDTQEIKDLNLEEMFEVFDKVKEKQTKINLIIIIIIITILLIKTG